MKRNHWVLAALAAVAILGALAYRSLSARDNTLWAADAATGAVRWSQSIATDDFVAFDPYASGSVVIVRHIDIQNSGKRRYAAYDANSGAPLWTFVPPEGVESRLRGHDEVAIIAGAPGGREIAVLQLIRKGAGDPVEVLYALDARDGKTLWTRDIGLSERLLAADGAPLIVVQNGTVLCIDSADGALRWRQPLGRGASAYTLALSADWFVSSGAGETVARELAGGAARFVLAASFDRAHIAGDTLYWENDTSVGATRLRDQADLWRATLPDGYDNDDIVADDETVYVSALGPQRETLELLAFDRQTGSQRWQTVIGKGSHVSGRPLLGADAVLYFPFLADPVGLTKRDGRVRWRVADSAPYGAVGGENRQTVFVLTRASRWHNLLARYIVGHLPSPAPDEDSQP